MKEKTQLGIGVFVLISLLGSMFYVADVDQDNLYQCGETVGICFKLSAINSEGLQTRCYFNQSASRRYKTCKTGWIGYELEEIINLPEIEPKQEKVSSGWGKQYSCNSERCVQI